MPIISYLEDCVVNELTKDNPGLRNVARWPSMKLHTVGIRSVNPENLLPFPLPFYNDPQIEHSDYWRGYSVFRTTDKEVPCGCVFSPEKQGCTLLVRPFSHVANILKEGDAYVERDIVRIHIPYGYALLFRGDLYHMGDSYEDENRRIHSYVYYPDQKKFKKEETALPENATFIRMWNAKSKGLGGGWEDNGDWTPFAGPSGQRYSPSSKKNFQSNPRAGLPRRSN